MCLKVSVIRHAWVLCMLVMCVPGCVPVLCLGMTVYAVMRVTVGVWGCECECVPGKQLYMTICEQEAPMWTKPSQWVPG